MPTLLRFIAVLFAVSLQLSHVPLQGSALTTPDPLAGRQWALDVMGVRGAWASLTTPMPAVAVALLDSGVCADQTDLAGRVLPGYDFVDHDSDPQDVRGQGCALASIIAANIGDGIGMAGIAPNASILPLRVADAAGATQPEALAAAIRYAADNGAHLILIGTPLTERAQAVEDAVDDAVRRGSFVIAAAGDSGAATTALAAYPPVIAVGAADTTLRPAAFSASDRQIDLFAPGADVLALQPDGRYAFLSGTAIAAAQVAGVAALQIALGMTPTFDGINGIATVTAPVRDARYLELYYDDVYPLAREFLIPLRLVMEANRNHLPPEPRYVVSAFRQENEWALITLVPPLFVSDVPERRIEAVEPYVVQVTAQRIGDGQWRMWLVDSPLWEAQTPLLPTTVYDWRSPMPALEGGYRFPWQAGQVWWAINGWHDGNALDFQPKLQTGFAVLAAEAGRLREVCYDGYQSLLQIRHADGNATYYLHVAPDPVQRRQLLDQNVVRGQYLGDLVPTMTFRRACGEGFSRHLHFASADTTIAMDGYVLADIAATASCCVAPPEYTSTNVRVDVP